MIFPGPTRRSRRADVGSAARNKRNKTDLAAKFSIYAQRLD